MEPTYIRPQKGPQEKALASSADILIFGGEAGGGKTFEIILESIRHHDNPGFGGVIFRRTSGELTGAGSIWEDGKRIYPSYGKLRTTPIPQIEFFSGGLLQFHHLEHESDVEKHKSKAYAFIAFDELTSFTEHQFWYLLSRNRTTSGIKPYVRAGTNPDPDSFVRKLIAWWIDEDGFPDPAKDGVIRWFIRGPDDDLIWADTREELLKCCTEGQEPLSLTFIRSTLKDNPALSKKDPGYASRIAALPEVERMRLGRGNWNVRQSGGDYIKHEYFKERWEKLPAHLYYYLCSDYAVTEAADSSDPDCTEHGVFGVDERDNIYVVDWWHGQCTADVSIDALLDLAAKWNPLLMISEKGVIQRSIEPFLEKSMEIRKKYYRTHWVTSSTTSVDRAIYGVGYKDRSKRAKAVRGRAFQALASKGKFILPASAPWVHRVKQQVVDFPMGKDDVFDVFAHMGLAVMDVFGASSPAPPTAPKKRDYGHTAPQSDSWMTV